MGPDYSPILEKCLGFGPIVGRFHSHTPMFVSVPRFDVCRLLIGTFICGLDGKV